MTTGKTIALTRRTFVGKVMSLLLNMLSRLVITFLPRSKHLLISWLQSPSAVILEPQKIKSDTVYTVSPSICHEVMGLDAIIFIPYDPAIPLLGIYPDKTIIQKDACTPYVHSSMVWIWHKYSIFVYVSCRDHRWTVNFLKPNKNSASISRTNLTCSSLALVFSEKG